MFSVSCSACGYSGNLEEFQSFGKIERAREVNFLASQEIRRRYVVQTMRCPKCKATDRVERTLETQEIPVPKG